MGYLITPCISTVPPTKTYATWNPLDADVGTTFDATFTCAANGGAGFHVVRATQGISAGKVYWECPHIPFVVTGIANAAAPLNNFLGSDANGWGILGNGALSGINQNPGWVVAPILAYFNSIAAIIGFGLDMDAGTLNIWVNGIDRGIAFTGLVGTIFPAATLDGGGTQANFGFPLTSPDPSYISGVYTT